jgi:outer membrane lipoprotein carrier protein
MRSFLAILYFSISTLSWADAPAPVNPAPIDELISALQSVDSLQGSFQQTLYDDRESLLAESSGFFSLLKPGFFSWEITLPDNQLIIANPEFIWHHDRDLATVTRRPANSGANLAPLQILGGDDAVLRQHFRVEGGVGAYTLWPTDEEAGFKRLSLRLDDIGPASMEILDNLQQKIVINFINVHRDSELSAEDFSFAPPPESDVFYYDE